MTAAKTRKTDAAKIATIAARHEADGWQSYPAYSGRCMFGDTCPGITCPGYDVQKVVAAVRRAGIRNPSVDNMGQDTIVYWPCVKAD